MSTIILQPQKDPKAWGTVLTFHNGPDFIQRILIVEPQQEIPEQYHKKNHLTWTILSGKGILMRDLPTLQESCLVVQSPNVLHLPAQMKYRFCALASTQILEISSDLTKRDDLVICKPDEEETDNA
jgi:mannose-6-phosphate isomerase-like protein (cupin superfamily)